MPIIVITAAITVVALIGLMGLFVVAKMATNKIDLTHVVSGDDGTASLSRFQFLIFTFVIAMCFMVITLETGEFPKLDGTVLGLLGISSGSYVVAKSIQGAVDSNPNAAAAKVAEANATAKVAEANAAVKVVAADAAAKVVEANAAAKAAAEAAGKKTP